MDFTNQPILDTMFVSDDEAELNNILPEGYMKSMTMGDNTIESEVLAQLKEEDMEGIGNIKAELNENCHLCGKQVEHLDKHMLANHGEQVKCQLCNQNFSVGNLRWHILKEHCHNKVTKCSLCEQKFITKNALKNHVKQIHLSETSRCSICHKEYTDLYQHVKLSHENTRDYKCSYCENTFNSKGVLYSHIQSIHLGEKTNCPDCKIDISVDNFYRHVKEIHQKIRKQCPHCEKDFAMSNLSRHIKIVHNNESTECPQCGKAMTSSNLTKHIKSVHTKLKRTCDICNAEVPYSSISIHKRKMHNLGKPMDDVTPRGPNLKLRKNYKQTLKQGEDFYKLSEEIGFEDIDLEEAEDDMESKTLKLGDKNFTFTFV